MVSTNVNFSQQVKSKTFNLDITKYLRLYKGGESVKSWIVNGRIVDLKQDLCILNTNYPNFDTIVYYDIKSENKEKIIYALFNPDYDYYLTIGCCDEGFDIFRKEKWNKNQSALLLTCSHSENKDSLFAYFGDNHLVPGLEMSIVSSDFNSKVIEIDKNEDTNSITKFGLYKKNTDFISVFSCYFLLFGAEQISVSVDIDKMKIIKLINIIAP